MTNSYHLEMPGGVLQVSAHEGAFAFDELLGFGARANNKRGFLFVSKVLGKHWPSIPSQMLALQQHLAAQIPALPGPILFIAMAETAIGLGQGVFEAWRRGQHDTPALFLHSSRYRTGQGEYIEFAESHSHAPRQFLHLPDSPEKQSLLAHAKSLVIIDDEASTGNTFVNLVAALRPYLPHLQAIHLGVLANFVAPGQRDQLALGLPYSFGSALSAQYQFERHDSAQTAISAPAAQRFDAQAENGASAEFGRLGITQVLATPHALAQKLAKEIGSTQSVLVLGTGEFMHPPFLLALAMQELGMQVRLQSTTRSPILCWGAISHAREFADNYGEGILNYLYNVAPGQYQHIFLCHETPTNAASISLAQQLGARTLHFLSEHEIEEIPVR